MEHLELIDLIKSLPWFFWFSYIGGILGFFLTVFKIYEVLRPINVDVRLTKEIFFRFSDLGECLFPNILLVSRNGDSEIKNIIFKLKKKRVNDSDSEKLYNVEPAYFGERVSSDRSVYAENSFYTTSPIFFISPSKPLRLAIIAILSKYSGSMSKLFFSFEKDIKALVGEDWNKSQWSEEEKSRYLGKIRNCINDYSHKIINEIQLESGEYELQCIVEYKPSKAWSLCKTARSSISFKISEMSKIVCNMIF